VRPGVVLRGLDKHTHRPAMFPVLGVYMHSGRQHLDGRLLQSLVMPGAGLQEGCSQQASNALTAQLELLLAVHAHPLPAPP
jgi:hypothetical protein